MLSDFRRWELSQAGELIHCGLWHAQKSRYLRHGQNLAFGRWCTVDIDFGCCCDGVVHDGYAIGGHGLKL